MKFILTADVHLREHVPTCRTDNFVEVMLAKLEFIESIRKSLDATVLVAGDVFDRWKPSPWLLAQVIERIGDKPWIVIPGQHDLPGHNISLYEKTGLAVLEAAGKVVTLLTPDEPFVLKDYDRTIRIVGFPYGTELTPIEASETEKTIVLLHALVYRRSHVPFPGAEDIGHTAGEIVRLFKNADLIVSGDNHQSFSVRHLVNTGPILRTTVAQSGYEPRIWTWDSETGEIKTIVIPHEEDVISHKHLSSSPKAEIGEDEEAAKAFVMALEKQFGENASALFDAVLEQVMRTRDVKQSVREIIYRSLDMEEK